MYCFTFVDMLMFLFDFICMCRMVKPSCALPLSCVRGPTQNAVCMVRVLMGSVTWTAALKTPTALTLWTQHGKTGQSLQYLRINCVRSYMMRVCICITCSLTGNEGNENITTLRRVYFKFLLILSMGFFNQIFVIVEAHINYVLLPVLPAVQP